MHNISFIIQLKLIEEKWGSEIQLETQIRNTNKLQMRALLIL